MLKIDKLSKEKDEKEKALALIASNIGKEATKYDLKEFEANKECDDLHSHSLHSFSQKNEMTISEKSFSDISSDGLDKSNKTKIYVPEKLTLNNRNIMNLEKQSTQNLTTVRISCNNSHNNLRKKTRNMFLKKPSTRV